MIPKVPEMLRELKIPDRVDLAADKDYPFILQTGELEQIGVNVNELISADRREPITGNPIHKYIPCRIEKIP